MSSDRARRHGARWRNHAALVLGVIACTQMLGYITGSQLLRGIGAATVIAPLPKVFSDVDGLETFASEFTLRYRDARGTITERRITPELYGRLAGPYNRRNVYGAALSYGPRLPRPVWEPVFCYGLSRQGPLRSELGLDSAAGEMSVTIRSRTRGRTDTWTLESACTR